MKEKRMIGRKNIGREHASSLCMFLHERMNLLLQAPRKETTLLVPPTHYHQTILPCIKLLHATLKMYPACLAMCWDQCWELITVNMLGLVGATY